MTSISSMDSNNLIPIFAMFIQAIKPSILSLNMIYTTFENLQNIIVSDNMTIGSIITTSLINQNHDHAFKVF